MSNDNTAKDHKIAAYKTKAEQEKLIETTDNPKLKRFMKELASKNEDPVPRAAASVNTISVNSTTNSNVQRTGQGGRRQSRRDGKKPVVVSAQPEDTQEELAKEGTNSSDSVRPGDKKRSTSRSLSKSAPAKTSTSTTKQSATQAGKDEEAEMEEPNIKKKTKKPKYRRTPTKTKSNEKAASPKKDKEAESPESSQPGKRNRRPSRKKQENEDAGNQATPPRTLTTRRKRQHTVTPRKAPSPSKAVKKVRFESPKKPKQGKGKGKDEVESEMPHYKQKAPALPAKTGSAERTPEMPVGAQDDIPIAHFHLAKPDRYKKWYDRLDAQNNADWRDILAGKERDSGDYGLGEVVVPGPPPRDPRRKYVVVTQEEVDRDNEWDEWEDEKDDAESK